MSNTKQTAQNQAQNVAQDAKGRGQEVAGTAKQEASQVAGTAKQEVGQVVDEARGQAKGLLNQARSEVNDQAGNLQQQLAQGLRTLGEEFSAMAQGAKESDASTGKATQVTRALAGEIDSAAGWLENREPRDVLDQVTRYARRNSGAFLLGAAIVGLVGGRLTRSLTDDARDDDQSGRSGQSRQSGRSSQGGGYDRYERDGYDRRYQFDGGDERRGVREGYGYGQGEQYGYANDDQDREGYRIRRTVTEERDVTDLGAVDGYVGNDPSPYGTGGRGIDPVTGRERL